MLAGYYTEDAIIEDERIIIIDMLGLLYFKDKSYKSSKDTSRKNLLEPYKIFYEYLQKSDFFELKKAWIFLWFLEFY